MNVEQTKRTLMNLPPRISVLLQANHGLGKSEVIHQVGSEMSKILGKTFTLIDFRLAQCEIADIIGMMRHVDVGEVTHTVFKDGVKTTETKTVHNVTIHDVAEWFPQDPDSHGILFLDELFRAPRDIQNAIFELALDYKYHFKELPIGWRVVSASNDNMDLYNGAFPDPALYDRFLKIDFRPTVKEWLDFARSVGTHKAIVKYIEKIPNDLSQESMEQGKACPSPRAWINLSKVIIHMEKTNNLLKDDLDYTLLLAKGYLGDTVAMNFIEYIRKNYKIFSGKDIVSKWTHELEQDFSMMLVPELGFYHTEVIKYVKEKGKLSPKESMNILSYIKTIPVESSAGFWSQFNGECRDLSTTWYNKTKGAKDFIFGFLSKAEALKKK